MSGAYVPLTMEGNIVVDGVLASCYASLDHDTAHLGMKAMRLFPEVTEWIYGKDNTGPSYVNIMEELHRWVLLFKQNK